MSDGLVLPRIRVRSRRRKPRGPMWLWHAACLCYWLSFLVLFVFIAQPFGVAGSALIALQQRRMLQRPQADPESPPASIAQRQTDAALILAGIAALAVNVVVGAAS